MAFVSGASTTGGDYRYRDPYASEALAHLTAGRSALGEFVQPSPGLGFFGVTVAGITKALPFIRAAVQSISRSGDTQTDPISAIWRALPAEAINAYVGSDGWWYDRSDNHKLSHDEAARRQQAITAASIGATVGAGGWWVAENGSQLSHADAWAAYQRLAGITPQQAGAQGGTQGGTQPGAQGGTQAGVQPPTNTKNRASGPNTGGAVAQAGITPQTLMILGGAAVALLALSRRRR